VGGRRDVPGGGQEMGVENIRDGWRIYIGVDNIYIGVGGQYIGMGGRTIYIGHGVSSVGHVYNRYVCD